MIKYNTYIKESWKFSGTWREELFDSIDDNKFEKFKEVLDEDISTRMSIEMYNSTLLLKIINNNRIGFFDYIKNDVDLNYSSSNIKLPLIYSLFHNNFEMFQILIGAGADINMKSRSDNLTPLLYAAVNNNIEQIELCIVNGADWSIEGQGRNFIDLIKFYEKFDYITEKYQEEYKNYLKKKQTKKFKI